MIFQWYIVRSRKPLVRYKVLLIGNQVVRCTRIAYPFIRKSHATHSYCRKHWTCGIVHWRCTHAICRHWFLLVSFLFPTILFQIANLPKMKTGTIFSVVFGLLRRPTCLGIQRLIHRGRHMCHECTWLCRCRRCLVLFFDRAQFLKQTVRPSLVIIKRLPDIAKFLVLRSICCQDLPMQQFNLYVVVPRITSQP